MTPTSTNLDHYRSVRGVVERDLRERYPEQASAPWIRKEASRYAREFVPFLLARPAGRVFARARPGAVVTAEEHCRGCERRCTCPCGCRGHSHMRRCVACGAEGHVSGQ